MITQNRLKELLDYDPVTGLFKWNIGKGSMTKVGKIAGCLDSAGYVQIMLDKKNYRGHRLAWLWVNGCFPKELDHRNGIKNDNRLDNLRVCTRSQNSANSKRKRLGLKGVYLHRQSQKWTGTVEKNYKKTSIGYFDSETEAHESYIALAKRLFGEFARAA